ncbi:aminopeptidase P N-terminal domain-containing protein [Parvicella tangerina]|uniref:Xaa-Pro aminopeptidase n=1 Tax=Parvicella tangerina TaxID=2829795 RepID=A0A916NBM1_9FLAO|nr:aminopeptidase P N-terminal domain-containing protein [Parvicella tangerina]CAG5083526.1 Xaa-Pro aminopeptidase [Parvicella tangerina]
MKGIALLLFVVAVSIAFGQGIEQSQPKNLQTEDYDQDLLPASFHEGRRKALREMMPENSVAIFFSNPVRNRSNDVDYEYHQDPNFYYLTGLTEPNSILLVFSEPQEIDGEKTNEVIFVQERDESKEVWNGPRLGVEGVEKMGLQKVMSNKAFKKIDLHLNDFEFITYSLPTESLKDNPFDKEDMYNLRQQFEAHLFKADDHVIKRGEFAVYMAKLREVKTKEEIALMRRAIDITCQAQIELLKSLEPGMKEYQSEAIVEFIFKLNGAEYPGFPSIQGSGMNSCVLHYQTNRKAMIGANLLVSDVGAEYHGYTADVTRTMPVDGKFSIEEAAIYNLVLAAQEAGIKEAEVGNNFWAPNIAATTVLSQGLMELGIIQSPAELKRYFMHGTSHYLGLDVHDTGTYGKLKENSVITVEPGIYIPENSPCDEKWWNIGVRIEDDILITKDGPENLSACIPRTIPEIEQLMSQKSFISP